MGLSGHQSCARNIVRALVITTAMTGVLVSTPAFAGEEPLYQKAPDWVDTAEAAKQLEKASAVKSGFVLADRQTHISKGKISTYVDLVYNIDTPEMMTQAGMLNGAWNPAHGDLIVHRVEILRGGQVIDGLAGGRKFEVLRREEALSQYQLTGILTAMLQLNDLRIGDRVRFSVSTTRHDPSTGDKGEFISPLTSKPAQIFFARTQISWPGDEQLKWKVRGKGVGEMFTPASGNKPNRLTIIEPLAEQPDKPAMAPLRYSVPPLAEVSGFSDWQQVSRTNAVLYQTQGLIADGSPLALEADKIAKATKDPKQRAAKALELVQREVRYLFNGMGNGNYVPQTPAKTWELRYGDCKAKTLLLLALLHRLDVDGVPALVNSSMKDAVSERLPAFGVFDHIIVKSVIGGETYWLDGTRNGDKLANMGDVPDFRYALPSTAAGADLEAIAFRQDALPVVETYTTIDLSNGFALPAPFKVKRVLRGEGAALFRGAQGKIDDAKMKEGISAFLQPNEYSYIVSNRMSMDDATGTVTLEGEGIKTTSLPSQDGRRKLSLSDVITSYAPEASRGKAEWANIPFAPEGEGYTTQSVTYLLPNGSKGLQFENIQGLKDNLAGYDLSRNFTQKPGVLEVSEMMRRSAWELPFDKFLADKSKLAAINNDTPEIFLPADYPPAWLERKQAREKGKIAPIVKMYDIAVADEKEGTHALSNRANFYEKMGEYSKGIADLTAMIAREPVADNYSWRAYLHYLNGDLKAGEADARKALSLDSTHQLGIGNLMLILERAERYDEVLELVDQWKAMGTPDWQVAVKRADVLDVAGRPQEAIKLLEDLNAKKPGNPVILNSLCWVKGRNSIDLEGGLKQCTKAIELAEQPAAILDSRGLIYYRMKRYDDALADYDAALALSQEMEASYLVRGLIKIATGKKAEGDADIAAAREIGPYKVDELAKVGLKP